MIDWLDARRLAHETGLAVPRAAETLPLAEAAGRTLAGALHSLVPLPGCSSSAMDGWAVAGDAPWRLGTPIFAGDAPGSDALLPGTARAIATGGPVPPGTRGVLRSEHGTTRPGAEALLLERNSRAQPGGPLAGENIRLRGEETGGDERVLAAGSILTPPRIALAAVTGHDLVGVTVAPAVDVLLLGSEIVGSGLPGPGEVRDAYSPQFPALLGAMGLRLQDLRRASDDLDATVDAILAGDAPLLISTGGTARGPADHVRVALDRLGATLVIDGVSMRPGHPIMLARLAGGRLMLCLPGNPLAAMLGLLSVGAALVDGLLGRPLPQLGHVPLAADVANLGSHTRLVAFRHGDDGAVPTAHQGSGMLRGLAEADGVAVIPPGGAIAPTPVRTLPLPW
ncbi:MAG TPA: molybdopterin molybdotransferase MoeA [Cryobacterium sp.]|nr:molybdopterin molybdotransferase MoeA [Cryobacterium sp.]